jgi:hypothetical protein
VRIKLLILGAELEYLRVGHTYPPIYAFREHSGNIHPPNDAFIEHSGNIHPPYDAFREHSGNIQETFRKHSPT